MINFFYDYGYIIEICLSMFIFVKTLKRRSFFPVRCAICIGLMFLVMFVWKYISFENAFSVTLKFMILYGICLTGIWFCFDATFIMSLFCWTGAWATQRIGYRIGGIAKSILGILSVSESLYMNIAYVMCEFIFYFVIYFIFGKKLEEEKLFNNNLNDNYGVKIVVSFGFLMFVLTLTNQLYEMLSSDVSNYISILYAVNYIVAAFFILYWQFEFIKRGKLQKDNALLEYVIHSQTEQYAISKNNLDLVNIKCHDLRKQINMLGEKISRDEYNKIEKVIKSFDSKIKTGNEVIDMILAEKISVCEKENINIDCLINGSCLSFMSQTDLYSIFENAIQNAIEASLRVGDVNKRLIKVYVKEKLNFVSIHFDNYYEGDINFENDMPQTIKENKSYHGFGLKSIKLVTESYNGYMSLNADDNIFKLNLLFVRN